MENMYFQIRYSLAPLSVLHKNRDTPHMNTTQALEKESISKLLLQYAIPTIIAMMVNGVYNALDRVIIGHIPHVGALATIGVGIAMPIMTGITAFGMLIGSGAVARISI